MEDLIDIDGSEDDIKDDGLLNKLLGESFYFISSLSVYDYLDYTDFFIFIWFEGMGKGVIVVIIIMLVMVGTLLVVTAEIAATPGKEAIAVIVAIFIMARTPLVAMVETIVTLGTRLN